LFWRDYIVPRTNQGDNILHEADVKQKLTGDGVEMTHNLKVLDINFKNAIILNKKLI